MFEQCHWINEPADWRIEHDTLLVTTDANTDFWRKTHYGFIRDTGHVFAASVRRFHRGSHRRWPVLHSLGRPHGASPERWVKAGAEYNDGALTFSTVLTDERSDWSPGAPARSKSLSLAPDHCARRPESAMQQR